MNERAADGEQEPESQFERHLEREQIQLMLMQCALSHRQILVLRYYQEMSLEEIAETMECSLTAAKVRLHRARLAFKACYVAARPEEAACEQAGRHSTGRTRAHTRARRGNGGSRCSPIHALITESKAVCLTCSPRVAATRPFAPVSGNSYSPIWTVNCRARRRTRSRSIFSPARLPARVEALRASEQTLTSAHRFLPEAGDLSGGFYARLDTARTSARRPNWLVAAPALAACGLLLICWRSLHRPVAPSGTPALPMLAQQHLPTTLNAPQADVALKLHAEKATTETHVTRQPRADKQIALLGKLETKHQSSSSD